MLSFAACKTDVEIYADGEETTIVYGYLDVDADTNYLKITKTFVGNALELAPQYDASNYDYKLDVQLTGRFANNPNHVMTVALDTVSVYKPYDPNTLFYSGRDQVLYYTTAKLLENQNYDLLITLKDGKKISSTVKTISNSVVTRPTRVVNFESGYTNKIMWKPNQVEDFAAFYEVVGYFHYKQLNPGETDTVDYTAKWVFGSGTAEDLWSSGDYRMLINYTPNSFYSILKSDDNFTNNSPDYVQRFAGDFEIVVTSTGDELYNYILIQNSGSAIQDTPEYTNIENGMGIFSSRAVCRVMIPLAEQTIITLIEDYPEWGFVRVYQ